MKYSNQLGEYSDVPYPEDEPYDEPCSEPPDEPDDDPDELEEKPKEPSKNGACPENGTINFDFGIYPACRSDCHIRDTCKKQHNVDAVQNKESFHFSFFYVEAGLLCNQELTADEAILLGYIAYRSQEFRYCNETNERLCRLLKKLKKDKAEPVSERTIGRILKRLIDKEYLETRYLRRLKSKGVFYRTNRKLLLTNKAVSSMNIFRTDHDKPYYFDHSDGGKLKQR